MGRRGGAITITLLALTAVMMPGAQAQWGMGGKKNKGDGAVRPEDIPGGLSFNEMEKLAKHNAEQAGKKGGAGLAGLDIMSQFGDGDISKILDEVLESPEIQAMMDDPEMFKKTIKENPLMSSLPNLDKILDSPEFNDPKKIKKIMKEGVDQFKSYTEEVVEMIKDPAKMEEAVEYLESLITDEEKDRIRKLATGEAGAVSEEMTRLREMFSKTAEEMKLKLMDPETIEKSRQEYLDKDYDKIFKDKKLKEAAQDADKWQEIMMENARLLYAKADDEL